MTFRKIVGKLHLWLGLASGLVVLVSMLAAAVFVWDEELTEWYYGNYVFVQPEKSTVQPMALLLENARKAVPGKVVSGVAIEHDPRKSYVFYTYKGNENPQGFTHWANYEYWDEIYLNPYTGEVIGTVNMLTNWIDLTRRLHQNLLLRYDIGHYIVGFATLFILVMLATGLILWFPKNKAALKQRFSIKWKARWRRVNYDLHNVGGFYTWLLIAILAITGLVWTFDWWTDGIYRILGDNPDTVFKQNEHPQPAVLPSGTDNPLDKIFADLLTKRENWNELFMDFADSEAEEPRNEVSAYLSFDKTGWDDSDSYYYHAQTGELVHQVLQEQKTIGEKWRNSNYAIHVGSIYGLPTKILACFAALFLASLPVTGFYIWWGRKKKKKPAAKSKAPPTKALETIA